MKLHRKLHAADHADRGKLGIGKDALESYGRTKAKLDIHALKELPRRAKLVLVTAINPTPAGEGKTTTSVGLAHTLARLGKNPVLCLCEPSLGSVFGVKGGKANGVPREDGFDITAASEIMAVLYLANSLTDLKARLARMVVAYTRDDKPVTAHDLKAEGAMAALLKDAIKPNLVQTLEHTPRAGPRRSVC